MAAGAGIATSPSAGGGSLRLVWRSWRGITARELGLALLLGGIVGFFQGSASLLMSKQALTFGAPASWRVFASPLIDAIQPALLLLLCLAVARNVTPRRLPAWVPFALAALAAALLMEVTSMAVVEAIGALDDRRQWPGLTMDLVQGKWLNVPPTVLMCFLAAFGYKFALDARRRADALRTVQLDGRRLDRQAYESRLQAMQARVEPQFLFDALREIEALYEQDDARAERMLEDLIVYLRGVLPSLEASSSTVAIELAIARARLDIASAMRGGRLVTSLTIRDGAGAARLPPMVLLPLLDHALRSMTAPAPATGTLAITASREGDRLRVAMHDSTGAFATAAASPSVTDVASRLHTLYGAAASLSFAQVTDGSTAVLELPYEHDA